MNKKILSLLLVLVSVGAGVYFRFYPHFLPSFDIVAAQEVRDAERTAIRKGVQEKYPDLPLASQSKIIEAVFKDDLRISKNEMAAKASARSGELKDRYRDSEGHVYLSGIDSYYWFRLLSNLLEKGHIGDRVTGGVEYDDLIGNPIDSATKKNVHLWLGWIFYKTASFFHPGVCLQEVLFYIPIFLSCILAIFSFYTARKLGANDLGAFFASVAINLSPFLLSRSIGEWFDTDIYNVLFPLLVFGIFLYALNEQRRLRRIFYCALSGLFFACYASTWKGWWFIFDIMFISGLFFVLNQKLSQEETQIDNGVLKNHMLSVGFFFIFSSIFVIVLNGLSVWLDFIKEPLRLLTVLKVTSASMWPNVFWTVAELAPMKPLEIVNALGGDFIFLGSLLCLVYIFLWEKGLRDNRYGFGLLCIVLWIFCTFYSAIAASRFVLLLVVPVGLAFGLAITKLHELLAELSRRYLKGAWISVARCSGVVFLSFYLISNILSVHAVAMATMPMMDDYWYHALTKIKADTPPDSIINSWWDYGHWFKAVAQRRVLFDGMTQDTPTAYWIARVLLTDKEEEAVGILRMINANDNKAVLYLQEKEGMALATAVDLVKEAVREPRETAEISLGRHLSAQAVQELLKILFPQKMPRVYFIVSSDMIQKIVAISYIGNWDFKKIDMWLKKSRLAKLDFMAYLMKTYGYSREAAEKRFLEVSFLNDEEAKRWFSHVWGYFSVMSSCKQDGQLLLFDNGLVVNQEDHHAYCLNDIPEKRGVPKSLIFYQDGRLKEVVQKDPGLSFSALLFKEGDQYKSILLDTPFAKSMLIRLYLLKGEGLKAFKLWHKEVDEKGNAIYIYEIQWPQENEKIPLR